jgi:hypothetical protein
MSPRHYDSVLDVRLKPRFETPVRGSPAHPEVLLLRLATPSDCWRDCLLDK